MRLLKFEYDKYIAICAPIFEYPLLDLTHQLVTIKFGSFSVLCYSFMMAIGTIFLTCRNICVYISENDYKNACSNKL